MAIKVYVAEDSPTQALFVKSILRFHPELDVEMFEDGLSLYQQILSQKPDFILLDIILPNLTGLAVCRLVKFHDAYKDIPVLMVSSITDADIADKARKAGATGFLRKPLKKNELQAKVVEFLGLQV